MPDKRTIEKARRDKREGKSASTQAGEFVRGEIDKIRCGEHGARSTKQAIAIGLSEARRSGVDLPPPKRGQTTERTRRSAEYAYEAGQGVRKTKRRPKVSRAVSKALKREPRSTASRKALSRQAHSAATRRTFRSGEKGSAHAGTAALEPDELWFDRHPALAFCLSMIFSENRIPPIGSKPEGKLFRIML